MKTTITRSIQKQSAVILSHLLFLILHFFSYSITLGQSYHTLASVGYQYYSPDLMPVNNRLETFYFRASLPLKIKNDNYLIINPDLHKQTFVFDRFDTRKCFKLGLSLAYLMQTKSGNVIAVLNSSNNHERGNMSSRSFQIGAGVLISKKYNKNFKLKYGLYCNREFFGLLIVPLLGLDYKINSRLRVFGILPQNMKLEFKPGKIIRTGILFETPLNTYMLKDKLNRLYLDQRQIMLGLFTEFYVTSKVVAQLTVKYPVFNSQKIFNTRQTYNACILGIGLGGERKENSEPISLYRHGMIIEIGMQYRLEIE